MVHVLMHPAISRPHASTNHRYNSSPFFNSEFKFLLIHESNFHVIGFSYGSNTHDVVERVSHSRATSTVTIAAVSSWILAATACSWILAATASNWLSRPEFQHSSHTFRPGILAAATVGTSSWRASPTMGNTSMDDNDTATTFFFTTGNKSFVPTFNCFIHNTSKCQTTHLLIHLCLQASFFVGWM
jgi:hypothetical protein